jgi:hypothetical protein
MTNKRKIVSNSQEEQQDARNRCPSRGYNFKCQFANDKQLIATQLFLTILRLNAR